MFDDAIRKLNNLARKFEQLDGQHQVSLPELFPDEFMLRNTDYVSMNAMFSANGFTVDSSEDFAAIPDHAWEAIVVSKTRFTSWDEMKGAAVAEWARRRLELE